MAKNLATHALSVRLPSALYARILELAEGNNSNLAEATRELLTQHFNRERLEERFDKTDAALEKIQATLNNLAVE